MSDETQMAPRRDMPVMRRPKITTSGGWNRKAIWSFVLAVAGIYRLTFFGSASYIKRRHAELADVNDAVSAPSSDPVEAYAELSTELQDR